MHQHVIFGDSSKKIKVHAPTWHKFMAMSTTIESVVGRVQTEPGRREWAIIDRSGAYASTVLTERGLPDEVCHLITGCGPCANVECLKSGIRESVTPWMRSTKSGNRRITRLRLEKSAMRECVVTYLARPELTLKRRNNYSLLVRQLQIFHSLTIMNIASLVHLYDASVTRGARHRGVQVTARLRRA